MRYFFIFLLYFSPLTADVHYAKVEPYAHYIIKSSVSGEVLVANENIEGRVAGKKPIIVIDSELDRAELSALKSKLASLKEMLLINEGVLSRKEPHYNKIKMLKTKSQTEKDREFYDLAVSKEKIETIKQQLQDLILREKYLQKSLRDKRVVKKGYIVYKLLTKVGEVVTPGVPLVQISDMSRAKLTIFLNADELKNIDKKSLYIDDKKSNLAIDKIWSVTDSEHISAYRAEIIMPAPKRFSHLVKVEVK